MSKTREALEAASEYFTKRNLGDNAAKLLEQIKAALAEPEQEPVGAQPVYAETAAAIDMLDQLEHTHRSGVTISLRARIMRMNEKMHKLNNTTARSSIAGYRFKKVDSGDVYWFQLAKPQTEDSFGIEPLYTSTQPREWQELSEGDTEMVCAKAEKLLEQNPNISWRKALIAEANAALRAKNEVKV